MKNIPAFLLLLMFAATSLAVADDLALWEEKLNTQIKFQDKVAEILLEEAPHLEEIILIGRDLQIAMYQMKREKYRYLVTHHPGRIDPDHDLNFAWTEKDESGLIQANKIYASWKDKKERLETKNQGHPQWPALREVFHKAKETEKYKRAQDELMKLLQR